MRLNPSSREWLWPPLSERKDIAASKIAVGECFICWKKQLPHQYLKKKRNPAEKNRVCFKKIPSLKLKVRTWKLMVGRQSGFLLGPSFMAGANFFYGVYLFHIPRKPRWCFQIYIYCMFIPSTWGLRFNDPNFDYISWLFQMGWNNQLLVDDYWQ